jgi:hypothetical protein
MEDGKCVRLWHDSLIVDAGRCSLTPLWQARERAWECRVGCNALVEENKYGSRFQRAKTGLSGPLAFSFQPSAFFLMSQGHLK